VVASDSHATNIISITQKPTTKHKCNSVSVLITLPHLLCCEVHTQKESVGQYWEANKMFDISNSSRNSFKHGVCYDSAITQAYITQQT